MRIAIHQPQFLPWLGYLDKIIQADAFVILDNVQFKKNEWQNRNRIRSAEGWQWVTVPIIHDFGQLIDEVRINNSVNWKKKHLGALNNHYQGTKYFSEYFPSYEEIYHGSWDTLLDFNLAILSWTLNKFNIHTPIILASSLVTRPYPTERLVDIIQGLDGTIYLAGQGAHAYMDIELFHESGLDLEIQEFQHPIYPQRYNPFISAMAAIDLLFNCGPEVFLTSRNREGYVREQVGAADLVGSVN